jgi:hypothetical protein
MSNYRCIAFIVLAACSSSKSKGGAPAAGSAAQPVDKAATPADKAPPPAPAPSGPLSVVSKPDDASCFTYSLARGGAAVVLPKDVAAAFDCPMVPPTVSPDGRAVIYTAGGADQLALMYWGDGAPRRLIQFDPGVDGLSVPTWSPSGAKIAVVVKGASYPKGTRLFGLNVSATGEVTDKVKLDVAVFAECGSVCMPEPAVWKDEATVEVVSVGDGEPGPKQAVALK